MKLIPLDAVLAEIERRYKLVDKYETNEFCAVASRDELVHLKKFINSLEVREVDLEEELIKWHKQHFKKDGTFIGMSGFYLTNSSQMDIAKHFFELGVNVSNPLTWEDIKIILDIENDILRECNSHKDLVIKTYPKGEDYYGEILKRFKAQKGE